VRDGRSASAAVAPSLRMLPHARSARQSAVGAAAGSGRTAAAHSSVRDKPTHNTERGRSGAFLSVGLGGFLSVGSNRCAPSTECCISDSAVERLLSGCCIWAGSCPPQPPRPPKEPAPTVRVRGVFVSWAGRLKSHTPARARAIPAVRSGASFVMARLGRHLCVGCTAAPRSRTSLVTGLGAMVLHDGHTSP
jgi:hypothetical protein